MPRVPPATEGRDVNGMRVFEQERSVYLGGYRSVPASCVKIREIAMGGLTCGGREADGNKGSKGSRLVGARYCKLARPAKFWRPVRQRFHVRRNTHVVPFIAQFSSV
jgi:hypothetical protein